MRCGAGARTQTEETEKTEIAQDMARLETSGFPGLEISCRKFAFRIIIFYIEILEHG